MTPEQEQAIADLRSRQVPPKQIARQLGLRPAEVSAIIQTQAAQAATTQAATGERPPLYQCLVNPDCLPALFDRAPKNVKKWLPAAPLPYAPADSPGFAGVTIARKSSFNRLILCNYLVDIWCLGVKDAMGPRKISEIDYKAFMDKFYRGFGNEFVEIDFELAQAIVWGGVEYAQKLGFSPHRDFEAARVNLEPWSGEPQLTFGKDGKPFYMMGPHDNPNKIIETLENSVGTGNFEFMMEVF